MDESTLPEYDKAPVVEVVCGVLFNELSALQAVHLGSLWNKLKPEYDHAKEVLPLAPAIETFDERKSVNLAFSPIPPIARIWLLTPTENGIVQVQRDRFLLNWKKVADDDAYPRFVTVIDRFRNRLKDFENFLDENDLGPLFPLQYELTYVNHIPKGDGWTSLGDIGQVFPDFSRNESPNRFLPGPDQVNWRTSYILPNSQGRLHTSIRHTMRTADKTPLLLFELTARGITEKKTEDSMWTWFDLAHEWIVRGFTDMTSEKVRVNVWEQKK